MQYLKSGMTNLKYESDVRMLDASFGEYDMDDSTNRTVFKILLKMYDPLVF